MFIPSQQTSDRIVSTASEVLITRAIKLLGAYGESSHAETLVSRMTCDEVLSWLRDLGADENGMAVQRQVRYSGRQLIEEVMKTSEENRQRRVRAVRERETSEISPS